MELNPQIIELPEGKVVILPYAEYNRITELLEDYEDSLLLKTTMEAEDNQESVSIEELAATLGVKL